MQAEKSLVDHGSSSATTEGALTRRMSISDVHDVALHQAAEEAQARESSTMMDSNRNIDYNTSTNSPSASQSDDIHSGSSSPSSGKGALTRRPRTTTITASSLDEAMIETPTMPIDEQPHILESELRRESHNPAGLSISLAEEEAASCHSLPATPARPSDAPAGSLPSSGETAAAFATCKTQLRQSAICAIKVHNKRQRASSETRLRRTRASSLPPATFQTEEPSTSKLPTAVESIPVKDASLPLPLPPLSHHQLLTLHNLHLPRPTFFSHSSHSARYTSARTSARSSSASLSITNLYIPSLSPQITRATLQELDLGQILRNSQLRHDIVFAPNLMFRPNFDGDRGKRKLELGNRYWTAIARELDDGCRCTAYTAAGAILPCICQRPGLSQDAVSTLSQGGSARQGRRLAARPLSSRLPSRIPHLVEELRAILISLLPSAHPEDLSGSSTSHSMIMNTLDPEFIAQEVAHGVLDVSSLAHFMARTLKMHCAPMRDELVDEFVKQLEGTEGESRDVARGLRLCFEVLELMKLDIANHQLRTLRPYLVETALDFERKKHRQKCCTVNIESMAKTDAWLSETASRLTASSTPVSPAHVVRDGLVHLVFSLPATFYDTPASQISLTPCGVPETLQMDVFRLQGSQSDATDLTVVYMVLMLFRQLASVALEPEQLSTMRQDIWDLMSDCNASLPSEAASTAQDTFQAVRPGPAQANPSSQSSLSCPKWRARMSNVMLHVAATAQAVKAGSSSTNPLPPPDAATLNLLSSWMDSHLQPDSKLFQMLHGRVRAAVDLCIVEEAQSQVAAQLRLPMSKSTHDLPILPMASAVTLTKNTKRCREPDEAIEADQESSSKRVKLNHEDTETRSKTDELLARGGLVPLQREIRLLANRIGTIYRFNFEVHERSYTALLKKSMEAIPQ